MEGTSVAEGEHPNLNTKRKRERREERIEKREEKRDKERRETRRRWWRKMLLVVVEELAGKNSHRDVTFRCEFSIFSYVVFVRDAANKHINMHGDGRCRRQVSTNTKKQTKT